MKVIDWERKGNVVRLYLGNDDCNDYWGDDWDDHPASCNAGYVYEEYLSGYVDISFPFEYELMEAKDDWHYQGNEPYSKEDYQNGNAPCLIIVPPTVVENYYGDVTYSRQLGDKNCFPIYFNDSLESVIELVSKTNATASKVTSLTYDKETRTLYKEDKTEFKWY